MKVQVKRAQVERAQVKAPQVKAVLQAEVVVPPVAEAVAVAEVDLWPMILRQQPMTV